MTWEFADPLRILHVITSTDAGGAERMLRRTVRVLRDRNEPPRVETRVLCIKGLGAIGRQLRDEGFDVETFDRPPPVGPASWPAFAMRELALVLTVRSRIRDWRPHVVQSWLPRADLVARFAAAGLAPVIGSVRAIHQGRDWPARLDGLTRGLVARWLSVSEAAADHHARLSGIAREHITVVPNALEDCEFAAPPGAADFRSRLGPRCRGMLVAVVARLHPQKGIDVLLRSLARIDGVSLAIAGDGPQRAALEALARSLGIADRVTFLGHLTDPRELLRAADAFVLPSQYEGMPGALLEAMAQGRACIATAIPGTTEVVRDGEDALLVPRDDVDALSSALARLRDDAALRTRLGEAARNAARTRHSMDAHARALLALHASVLGGSRGR